MTRGRGTAANVVECNAEASHSRTGGAKIARDGAELVDRIEQLLGRVRRESRSASVLLRAVAGVGQTTLFGGAVRDLAVARHSAFRSDLDLVVKTGDAESLARELAPFGAVRNRHGGFRLRADAWRFDIWPLSATWAIRNGYVSGEDGFHALPRTTFFSWDAVSYGIDTGILYSRYGTAGPDAYLAELHCGVLEINLAPNPNPAGNVTRAIRSLQTGRANALGERLTSYIADALSSRSIESEMHANGSGVAVGASDTNSLLSKLPTASVAIATNLLEQVGRLGPSPFTLARLQYQLPL